MRVIPTALNCDSCGASAPTPIGGDASKPLFIFINKIKGGLGVVSGGEATERIRSEESNAPQGGPRWVRAIARRVDGSVSKAAAMILAALALSTPAYADLHSAVAMVKQQPQVLDAVPDNAGNLWVKVLPIAGADYMGFAQALCTAVVPHHGRIFLIKIVDGTSVKSSKKPQDWRMLGGANCGN